MASTAGAFDFDLKSFPDKAFEILIKWLPVVAFISHVMTVELTKLKQCAIYTKLIEILNFDNKPSCILTELFKSDSTSFDTGIERESYYLFTPSSREETKRYWTTKQTNAAHRNGNSANKIEVS